MVDQADLGRMSLDAQRLIWAMACNNDDVADHYVDLAALALYRLLGASCADLVPLRVCENIDAAARELSARLRPFQEDVARAAEQSMRAAWDREEDIPF